LEKKDNYSKIYHHTSFKTPTVYKIRNVTYNSENLDWQAAHKRTHGREHSSKTGTK
jgi:hypothetical protein